jgi:hypothetical protein
MKKATPQAITQDRFKEELKREILRIIHDPKASTRDKNVAISSGTKLLQVEHKITGGDEGDFFS